MTNKTTGIVLHKIKYNDLSVIVKIFTQNRGIESFIVRTNKTSRKKGVQIFQPGNILYLDTLYNPKNDLQKIKEFSIAYPYQNIPMDMIRSSQLIFVCEVIIRTIAQREPDIELFKFIKSSFLSLDKTQNECYLVNFHLLFLTKLTLFLGFSPRKNFQENRTFNLVLGEFEENNQVEKIEREASKVFSEILGTKFDETFDVEIGKETRKKILNMLVDYYFQHVEGMGKIKSLKVLEEVAS